MELEAVRMRLRNKVLKSVTQHRLAAIVLTTRAFRRWMRLHSILHYSTTVVQVHKLLTVECLYNTINDEIRKGLGVRKQPFKFPTFYLNSA
jgi:hypothetical protein